MSDKQFRRDFRALAGPIAAEFIRADGYSGDTASMTMACVNELRRQAAKVEKETLYSEMILLLAKWKHDEGTAPVRARIAREYRAQLHEALREYERRNQIKVPADIDEGGYE